MTDLIDKNRTETMLGAYVNDERMSTVLREAKAFLAFPNAFAAIGPKDEVVTHWMAAFGLQLIDLMRIRGTLVIPERALGNGPEWIQYFHEEVHITGSCDFAYRRKSNSNLVEFTALTEEDLEVFPELKTKGQYFRMEYQYDGAKDGSDFVSGTIVSTEVKNKEMKNRD